MKNKDWKKVKLGEVCEIVSGSTPKRNNVEYWEEGTIPWVTPKDLSKLNTRFLEDVPEYITELGYRSCSTTLLPTNSLLFSSRAPIGHIAINKEPVCTNQGFKSFVPKAILDVHYLYYTMYFFKEQVQALGTGSTFKEVSKRVISDFQIPLPPISEQKAIAAQLDRADKLRQDLAQSLKDYDRLLAASFLDMFGDPVLNPKGWEVVKLGEVAISENNKRVPIKSGDRNNRQGKYPYYGASGIIDSIDDYTHEGTRLLVGEDGANLLSRNTPIGFLASGQYWVNNHAHVLKSTDKTELVYLLYFINCIDLEVYVTGSAQPKLNKKNLDRIPIPLPPLSLQQQFAQLVERIERQKALIRSAQQSAEDLFGALLQAYFYEGKIG